MNNFWRAQKKGGEREGETKERDKRERGGGSWERESIHFSPLHFV